MAVGKDLAGEWAARAQRIAARSARGWGDMARALSWHSGGKKYFSRYAPEILAAHKWCFVVGCNNSGTSLLHIALERTGQISTLPFEGQRYTNVLTRAHRRHHERVWGEFMDEIRLAGSDSVSCVPRLLHDWMREFDLPVREMIVEKTTANAVRMIWLQKAFPNSYFIGMVRNGYAVTEGIMRKGKKSAERGARHWNLVNRLMMEDSVHVERFLEVRYEDLVDTPGPTVSRIAGFLGLPEGDLNSAMKQDFSFTTLDGRDPKPVVNMNARSIASLSVEDISVIRREAAPMLDHFGYETV